MIAELLSGLPSFLTYFLSGVLLLGVFTFLYIHVTPHQELALIRKGNVAVAVGFAGALLGYTLPLASAIAHSVSYSDMLLWGGVGLVVQVVVLGVARLMVPDLFRDMEKGKLAPAVLLATLSLAAGLLNAASMTY
jgi:putative membrane protein